MGAFLLGGSAGWNTVVMTNVVKRVGRQAVGRASGGIMAGFFTGFIVAPVTFGSAVDMTDGYAASWGTLASLLFATFCAVSIWARRSGPIRNGLTR